MRVTTWIEGNVHGCIVQPLVKYQDPRGWLTEIFRQDQLPEFQYPVMAYISLTRAGIARGPHEHKYQTDLFTFFSGKIRLYLWDNHPQSSSFGRRQTIDTGEHNPLTVSIPPGVIHAYRNIGTTDALILNCPNQLYAGKDKKESVDEIRYEDLNDHNLILD